MCHTKYEPSTTVRKYASGQQSMDSIALQPVMWGVAREPEITSQAVTGEDLDRFAGHCSFTTGMVEPPQVGKKYQ